MDKYRKKHIIAFLEAAFLTTLSYLFYLISGSLFQADIILQTIIQYWFITVMIFGLIIMWYGGLVILRDYGREVIRGIHITAWK